ncbi:MAG: esterase [Thiomonas sp. 20-64-9]|uniref:SGNH/GDSL hydrolase family protein n=2 Tax=unclassified Thiomonas TaxID=2625466 RepID=UPI000BD2C962|nr:SGNH/GDSL hydrolase family protein [Thiomonas sp.]OYV31332.1 MAG: esterase [Thiomonas sp. 20-64-9]
MRNRVWIALALASALGLAGCGGGGNPSPPSLASVASVNSASTAPAAPPSGGFKQMVVFGDSLSDAGTYTPAVVATYYQYLPGTTTNPATNPTDALTAFGGSLISNASAALQQYGTYGGEFTVNPGPGWVADLATDLKVPVPLPNQIGYGYIQDPTTGAFSGPIFPTMNCVNTYGATDSSLCTNFAQGGSRVAQQPGIGYYIINPTTGQPYVNSSGVPYTSALTVPVSTQVQNYLAQFGTFNSNQLVTVLAGNNDIFTALGTVSATVKQAVTQAVTSALQQNPNLTQAQIAQIQAEAQQSATTSAVSNAQNTVATAADELAAQIKLITSKGAQYVMVYTLPDSSQTPFGRGLPYTGLTPPQTPPAGYVCDNTNTGAPCYLLSNLVQVFNQRLLNDLQGQPVKVLDGYSLLNQEVTNPAQFGFTNVTTPWCNPTTTSSLLCNVNTPYADAGASAANLGTWLFADTVHPTPAGYKIIASTTLQAMKGFGWISQ